MSMDSYFIKGPNGALFLCDYGKESSSCVIHFPAFAEEMNKSRHLVHLQAEALAHQGYRVLVLDPFGTGDSEGDFSEATPHRWVADYNFLISLLVEQGVQHFVAWGLRAGCLLAGAVAQQSPVFDRFLFWAPVLDGKLMFTQFLRLRIAASMMSGQRETANELKSLISDGESLVEIAGYGIHPDMPEQLEGLSLRVNDFAKAEQVFWVDINSREVELNLPARRLVEQLSDVLLVDVKNVLGDAFWGTQELVSNPELITQTASLLGPALCGPPALTSVNTTEGESKPLKVICNGVALSCLLHEGAGANLSDTAVIVVVGGPQYRVGSHRQFLLLSRHLAAQGITSVRFDYRGMGDSSGELLGFESVDDDIRSVVDALLIHKPSIKRVVLWGLCDAATASVFYAPSDKRVAGLVLLNPWVRSEQGEAEAMLKHYYLERVLSKSFWKKLFSGSVNIKQSISSFAALIKTRFSVSSATDKSCPQASLPRLESGLDLPARLNAHLQVFAGRSLVILSENDLTAAEFRLAMKGQDGLSAWFESSMVESLEVEDADHTFSTQRWRDQVADATARWVQQLDQKAAK